MELLQALTTASNTPAVAQAQAVLNVPVNVPVNLLTGVKQWAFTTNHLADSSETKQNYNYSKQYKEFTTASSAMNYDTMPAIEQLRHFMQSGHWSGLLYRFTACVG